MPFTRESLEIRKTQRFKYVPFTHCLYFRVALTEYFLLGRVPQVLLEFPLGKILL